MMTGSDAEGDIDLFRTLARRLDVGQHKTGCPVCQNTRRKNRHDKPLSIEVRAEGCSFTCHHCGVTGGFDFEDKSKYRRSHRTVTPMRPKIDVPENIYLPAWCSNTTGVHNAAVGFLQAKKKCPGTRPGLNLC